MFQKGPGEGYMAAKDEVLAIDPKLQCRAVYYNGRIEGFVISTMGTSKRWGHGRSSRSAWNDALCRLKDAARKPEDRP